MHRSRTARPTRPWLSMIIAVFIMPLANAQITFGPTQEQRQSKVIIRDLNWMNENFLEKQRSLADQLTRNHFGRQLRGDRSDLAVLQRLVSSGALKDADKQTLQAIGASLGDIFSAEHRQLNWKVYEDDKGPSHAVCLEATEHCIFPITMISRRMEAGLTPSINDIFEKNMAAIKAYIPRLPYSRTQD